MNTILLEISEISELMANHYSVLLCFLLPLLSFSLERKDWTKYKQPFCTYLDYKSS